MNKLTVEQAQARVKEKSLELWAPRDCSVCKKGYGYHFRDEKVFYSDECGCTVKPLNPEKELPWSELVSTINGFLSYQGKEQAQKIREFWGI